MTVLPDSSVLATGDKPNNDVYEVELPLLSEAAAVTAFRLEVVASRKPARRRAGPALHCSRSATSFSPTSRPF